MTTSPFSLARVGPGDEATVLTVMDRSVAWLCRRGFVDQWGTDDFSSSARRIAQVTEWVGSGQTYVAGPPHRPLGVLTLGEAPHYVAPTDRPEVYVVLLASSHLPGSTGVGRHLLEAAERMALAQGVDRLRVDCFAGNDGGLVSFYEGCGFSQIDTFKVGTWPGAVLEKTLPRLTRPGGAGPGD